MEVLGSEASLIVHFTDNLGGIKSTCKVFAKPRQFCKLDVATSRTAFLDLNLNVLQLASSNSKNCGRNVSKYQVFV